MTIPDVPYEVLTTDAPVSALRTALAAASDVLIHDPQIRPTRDVADDLMRAALAPGVATASPVPVASQRVPVTYAPHSASPPAATLALPCVRLCAVNGHAVSSFPRVDGACSTVQSVIELAQQLNHHGWRHVAAPGVALSWNPADAADVTPVAGWNARSIASVVGPANAGLEAHVSWASALLDGVRLVVDGACLSDEPFTGTQHLVVEIARALASRPHSTILLAVRRSQINSVTRRLAGSPVRVIEREPGADVDVVYRPYQMLYAGELPFVASSGRRGLIGQLDMIGFSNAAYHPSEQLFFFARNLQRHLMRTLDGVTFISEFGLASAYAECPDLDPDRLHVVSCGTNPEPLDADIAPPADGLTSGFVACLSSTFWHKNRTHAIDTFARLVGQHGYGGSLVIAGPEPYFGRSVGAEHAFLGGLTENVRSRVMHLGHVDDQTKWWLLRHADLVLYPSIVEGFGLVPFEAATVGTPCLAYAGTAPGELLAGTQAVVDSWQPDLWAEHAARYVADDVAASALVDEVNAVSASHTWALCAERTWAAVLHALAAPRRSLHADDGSYLARVAPIRSDDHARSTRLRFDVARGLPAVSRRLARLWTRPVGEV